MTTRRSKYWVFTINNPVVEDEPEYDENIMDYLVYGKEEGSEEQTPHWQGFVSFNKPKRRTQLVRLFPRARVDTMYKYSTPPKAAAYCKKDGDYKEFGVCPKSKAQKAKKQMLDKWEDARTNAKAGNLDAIPADMYIKYYHGLKRIQQDHYPIPDPLDDVCGVWIHGAPGCGKTHRVKTLPSLYDKPLNKWWDNYHDEDNVLLDDVDKSHGSWIGSLLKRWADKWSYPAEQKGTTVWLRPKKLYVTSNYTIEEIFEDPALQSALLRRFEVIHMDGGHLIQRTDHMDGNIVIAQSYENANRFD